MAAAITITTTLIKAVISVYSMNEILFNAYYGQGTEKKKSTFSKNLWAISK